MRRKVAAVVMLLALLAGVAMAQGPVVELKAWPEFYFQGATALIPLDTVMAYMNRSEPPNVKFLRLTAPVMVGQRAQGAFCVLDPDKLLNAIPTVELVNPWMPGPAWNIQAAKAKVHSAIGGYYWGTWVQYGNCGTYAKNSLDDIAPASNDWDGYAALTSYGNPLRVRRASVMNVTPGRDAKHSYVWNEDGGRCNADGTVAEVMEALMPKAPGK